MRDKHSRGISTIAMVLIVGIVVVAIGATAIYFWWNQRELVGSGNLDTKVFDFTDFTIVEAGYGFKVEIDGRLAGVLQADGVTGAVIGMKHRENEFCIFAAENWFWGL